MQLSRGLEEKALEKLTAALACPGWARKRSSGPLLLGSYWPFWKV